MEKNVPAERNNHRKGVLSRLSNHWRQKKQKNFKNDMDDQKVKTLVLTVATQNLRAFMFMIDNKINIIKYILNQKKML